MYNLRPRKQTPSQDIRPEKPSSNKRSKKSILTPRKNRKLTDTFDPESFEKGNDYEGICDSSDSDTTIYSEEEERSLSEESNELSDFIVDENEEYFAVNSNPLESLITKRLKDTFPDLSSQDVSSAVRRSLKHANEALIDEYCEVDPKDNSWKAELTPEEVEALEPELKQLRLNIRKDAPTIPKILKSGLSTKEKERALQLYDSLKNSEPYTSSFVELRTKLSDMIMILPNTEAEEKLKELRLKIENKIPTIEKITSALLTESDKIRALQFLTIMQQCTINGKEWYSAQRNIQSILDSQMETPEEVARVESEESAMKGVMLSFYADLKKRIFLLDADIETKSRLYEMYCDMITREPSESQYTELKNKILWGIKLPYRKTLTSILSVNNLTDIYKRLDAELYGMKEAKERIIQCVNDRLYNPNSASILALKGKPGVGKTKLAKTIAKAAGLPFDKISLGGATDSSVFKGSANIWVGSTPSMLLQILSRVKYSNAVILLDEVDKLGTSDKGLEVQHALLHVLDPTTNKEFQDSFLSEFPHDISKIWFIPAMNDDTKLDPALRDRLNIIELPSYTRNDIVQIIKRHALPDALRD